MCALFASISVGVPDLGPPVPEQLDAGGVLRHPRPKRMSSGSLLGGWGRRGRGDRPSPAFAQLCVLNHPEECSL